MMASGKLWMATDDFISKQGLKWLEHWSAQNETHVFVALSNISLLDGRCKKEARKGRSLPRATSRDNGARENVGRI
jgi:hypothetical protein